jgi:hypothetical protein
LVALTLAGTPLLVASQAQAQGGDSGSIVGYVFDQAGNPLSGISITAISSTQIGGAKTAYTNSEGAFRFRALTPGVFEVRASAPKLQSIVQKDVKVGITSAVELTLMMEVKTATEEVTIIEKPKLVSTSKPNVTEEFDMEFIEALPHPTRDNVHREMLRSVPGAVANRMRGGAANQTIVTQDGFEMGTPGRVISPAMKSSAAFEIQTAGYGADNPGAPGGILNMVTRSGSNKFEFEFNATADADQLRFFRDERDAKADTFYYVLNPTIAGPIIKDKLWYFFNTETHFTQDGRQPDVEGVFPDPLPAQRIIQKGSFKLTWQATNRNKISFTSNFEYPFEHNRIGDIGTDPDAQEDRDTQRLFGGLIWESLLRDDLIFRTQLGHTYLGEHIFPSRCRTQGDSCYDIPSVVQTFPRRQLLNNPNRDHTQTDLFGWQFINQLDYLSGAKLLGEHNLKIKNTYYTEKDVRKASRPGDAQFELLGDVPLAKTTYYSADPRVDGERFGWNIGTHTYSKNVTTLADIWKPTRYLSLTPSVSYIWARGGNAAGSDVMNAATWAPGVSAVWDATHDGLTAIRGSFSNFVDLDVSSIARHQIPGLASRRCLWNTANGQYDRDCVTTADNKNTVGLPCGPQGVDAQGVPCSQKLKIPRTWEVTMGAEREIMPGVAVALDLVHRQFNNQYEVNETNRIWDASGRKLEPTGAYRNGIAETINDLETPDKAQRFYDSVTLGANKREGRLKVNAAYTWSRLDGTVNGGTNNPWGDIPGRDIYLDGPLNDDHAHEFKVSLTYQASSWLSFGSRSTYMSGFPYSRLFRNDVTQAYDLYRARRGSTPGTNLNDPGDDRETRLPDQFEVNVQTRVSLFPLIGHRLDFYVDVLNLLAMRTVTAVGGNDQQNYALPTEYAAPFRIRLGMNYKY